MLRHTFAVPFTNLRLLPLAHTPSSEPDDNSSTYREEEMRFRLKPEQFGHYRALPLADQVVIAHCVSEGMDYPTALAKLSQLRDG